MGLDTRLKSEPQGFQVSSVRNCNKVRSCKKCSVIAHCVKLLVAQERAAGPCNGNRDRVIDVVLGRRVREEALLRTNVRRVPRSCFF